jgi:hypothetical protein
VRVEAHGYLGYRSEKRLALQPNTPAGFAATFDSAGQFRPAKALADRWLSVDFMFQLTDDEIRRSANQNELPFESTKQVDNKQYSSYLFFTRGTLQGCARPSHCRPMSFNRQRRKLERATASR